ncbi:MAG: MotA/TolQ/ExbB proton channel family protein [Cyclonatronaceae bacterium]
MTKIKKIALRLVHGLLLSVIPVLSQAQGNNQDAVTTSMEDLQGMTGISSANLWDLIGQAGVMQYPIFGVLIIGIFLISLKAFELVSDKRLNRTLRHTGFERLDIKDIRKKVSNEPDHMLSRLMAKLLNVFLTNRKADYLHDEISNYYSNEQHKYSTFKNRIDFLSDTAGALGLLGTVWGMFIVFSSGALEKDVILAGMGLALMSTLLGLVVSIILNFFSTITEGYFARHLETVASKADELRFRLIELGEFSRSPEREAAADRRPITSGSNPE